MNTTAIITISIILVILAAIAVMYIVQAKERAKIVRTRKINTLQDRQRRMQRLFSEIPPQYLNKELRSLILDKSLETLNKLKPFNVDPGIDQKITECQNLIEDVKQDRYKSVPINVITNEQSKEIAKLLEILYRFIDSERKKKKLDPKSAKKYQSYISYLISKCRADYFTEKAKSSIKDGKLRVAIHNYHNAVQEFTRIKDNPMAIKAINLYRTKIRELDQEASQQTSEGITKQPEKKAPSNKEWDEFMDEDDTWKKKNAYDDWRSRL